MPWRRDNAVKERVRSLGVSIGLHVAFLFVLECLVSQEFKSTRIKLTISESGSDSEDPSFTFAAIPDTSQSPLLESEPLADVKPFSVPELLTSVSESTLRDSLEKSRESVQFFGSRAYGNRFVYILDVSTSMSARSHGRIQRAKDELIRSVSKLSPHQSYYVFLFCYETCQMYGHPSRFAYRKVAAKHADVEFIAATPDNLSKLKQWLYRVRLAGGTDPRHAISLAHSMDPDAVFLLSDGQFNRPHRPIPGEGWNDNQIPDSSTVAEGIQQAFSDVVIHTIAFENPFTRDTMARIAKITGGSSRYVRTESLQPIKAASLINGLHDLKRQGRTPALASQLPVRLRYAQQLIEDGELAFAEYLMRPIRKASSEKPDQQALLKQIDSILIEELGETRLEDFGGVSLPQIERKAMLNRYFNRYPN